MTTWHYAVAREKMIDPTNVEGEVDSFTIREVYLDDAGKLKMWSEDPMEPYGETWAELFDTLAKMGRASQRLILDLSLDPPALVSRKDLS